VLRVDDSTRSVLIIVQNLPVPLDRRVWQEATSLRTAGFRVAVICPKSKTYWKGYEKIEGIDIYRYPLLLEADESFLGYFVEFVYCWFATLFLSWKAYIHCPFSLIHACNPPDTYFAIGLLYRPLGVKFVFDHHDLCPDLYVAKGHQAKGMVYRLLLFLERITLRTADLVITTNESYREIAIRRAGASERNIVIVRSGPRRDWARSSRPDAALKQGRKYLVVSLGTIGKQDGIDYLLRAVHLYCSDYAHDTLFAVIGDGPRQMAMRRMAREMNLESAVVFTGRISDQQLCAYLATADLCVDPDPWTEFTNVSTMNKIIEYMSLGKAIVAFDLKEHRRSALEAACYVKPNDIPQYARAVRELLEDQERREQMSRFARARFEGELAWEVSEAHLLCAYQRLSNGSTSAIYKDKAWQASE